MALLAAALNGSDIALAFVGGRAPALALLTTKMATCVAAARGGGEKPRSVRHGAAPPRAGTRRG